MSEKFTAVSEAGDELEIFELASGLTSAINPSEFSAQPFGGSDLFRTASGQQVRQTRPGVFTVTGSDVEYERVLDQPE